MVQVRLPSRLHVRCLVVAGARVRNSLGASSSLDVPVSLLGSRLAALLGLKDTDSDAQSRTLLEMHSNNLNFAAEQGFSAEATSTFFSIMKSTFQDSMGGWLAPNRRYVRPATIAAFRRRRCLIVYPSVSAKPAASTGPRTRCR